MDHAVKSRCPYTQAYRVAPDARGEGAGIMLERDGKWTLAPIATGPYLDALWFRDQGMLTISEHAPE
jgi:hypothetical protein